MLQITHEGSTEFAAGLARLMGRGADDFEGVAAVVRQILADVRRTGDEAVRRYIEVFERRSPAELVLHDVATTGAAALARLEPGTREALEVAAQRIARYHEHQRECERGYRYSEDGVDLGLRVRPLARVGVYAPGGKARYPSSVLMAAIPARIAGVREIVLATPLSGSPSDDLILAAAALSGVNVLLDAGGAHAIGALAYGTQSLPRVDKIVGPGNVYVACAKRLVFGEVGIDGIAGPTEVCVLADESATPAFVAADLVSQAEHDDAAYPVLVTTSAALAAEVARCVDEQLGTLPRREISAAAIDRRGIAFVVGSRDRMAELASSIAPEHLSLHVTDAESLLERVDAVGAAFVGETTPVAAGDYIAGPSHVLPTGGCVRFGSPLGVYDFVARSSFIRYSREALERQAPHISALSRAEGLEGHARSVEIRLAGLGAEPPSSGPLANGSQRANGAVSGEGKQRARLSNDSI